ncbi:MAG: methylenetetrahydrofolate reductase [Nitrospiraceae bacterium]|nr:methylenetetrahydrofolate reductase [Nitrospiraceae bacterium]
MTFRQALAERRFLITAECSPPKGTETGELLRKILPLKGRIHAMNVTDNQTAVMRMCPFAMGLHLKTIGIDPIVQLTLRDRNRLALQSDIIGMSSLGIRQVLCLSGDPAAIGDHPETKPVFDLTSPELIRAITLLNGGSDLAGKDLNGPTDLLPGAATSPEGDLATEKKRFEEKFDAGARFFQTQVVFDTDRLDRFMEFARPFGVPVICGIILLKSPAMARYLNEKVPGIRVPASLIARLESCSREERIEEGIRIAAETIKSVSSLVSGVHIMTVGAEEHIPAILELAGL